MQVSAKIIYERDPVRGSVILKRAYTEPQGLSLKEEMHIHKESDFLNGLKSRISPDNGKTWSEWQDVPANVIEEHFGADELLHEETPRTYNPVHKHYVYTHWTRYFLGGHEQAYRNLWRHGIRDFYDHQYIMVADGLTAEPYTCQFMQYEDGVDFSHNNPQNPEFIYKNNGFLNAPVVLKCGDIVVPISPSVHTCCKRMGVDVNEVFPSCPHLANGVILARGVFNAQTKQYDFTFSNPVVIPDLKSSRGIDEPIVTELESGRLLLIMRGSNWQRESWNTRIADGTPGYKWFSYSDDGGKTFTEPAPWRFDDDEPVYSSATISAFIRSNKNGKLYWIGNITDKEKTYANFPRYPLCICEVDDETSLLKKSSYTVIDTKREGESEQIQLSNFSVYENRETQNIHLCLTKSGQFEGDPPFEAETWEYIISVE